MDKKFAKMVVYVNADTMGKGDDTLGEKLLNIFMGTLADFIPEVSHIALVNSGVKIVCTGSPSLDNMKILENAGVTILSCGTCLDHFGLREKIQVGTISNMFSILEAVTKAEKILTP